ncbi:hypothetical protein GQ44DRAFT_738847 [Phaeosphaeriaceae sp. PMI808]|nr:hypothetical protein GQ44DRAFT_738847 [Phaeosphaeriaceae sp. PMI808]
MILALEEACGEMFPPDEKIHTEATHDFLQRMLARMNVECPPPLTNVRMLDRLVGECIEEKCPEIVNANTELNDPFDQRVRFEKQTRQKVQGDDEVQVSNEGFLTAIEYSLPLTGGSGMGIDRMVMFLINNYNIKKVLAFLFMKGENVPVKPKAAEITGVESIPNRGILHK